LSLRLRRGMHADWRRAAHRVALATAALRASSPVARVSNGRHRLERLEAQLRNEIRHALDQARHHLGEAAGRLDSLSPLAVLGRGYRLTRTLDGPIVRNLRPARTGGD